ncbi:MAG TPA: hypothetical protein VE594_01590 [Nitrososphaeraceae archaeon]|jgi:hypothetical protein|nr:hypothetical protein [Nitrososphaeraceae archaeon]
MNKLLISAIITIVVGFIVTGIGTLVGSDWSVNNRIAKGRPYVYNTGIIGVVLSRISFTH